MTIKVGINKANVTMMTAILRMKRLMMMIRSISYGKRPWQTLRQRKVTKMAIFIFITAVFKFLCFCFFLF